MKKFLLLYKILLVGVPGIAQLTISNGTNWINYGNVTVTIQNMDLVNNGTFTAGTGSMKFTGNQHSGISGNNLPVFNILEIAKTNTSKVLLKRNISIGASLNFISGQLDLNSYNIMLASTAYIAGESENNRIVGSNGGLIEITQNMNAPASVNAGNLGATITSAANPGTVTIRRGHRPQGGTGLTTGIQRYYAISSENNTNLNATLRLKYFDSELNAQNENELAIYKSNDEGVTWNNLSQTARNANANYVEKTGMDNLMLQTLGNDNVVAVDGVTGLVLNGQRKKPTEVQLNWSSQTETNMSGYEIQRKLDVENDYSVRTYVNSFATGGNSPTPLSYQYKDANGHSGNSYYRLKITTLNGSFTYSNEIAIIGKSKGGGKNNREPSDDVTAVTAKTLSQTNSLNPKITVGPNPNNGHFWFNVSGIEKETVATLFYIDGRQIKQFRIVNLQQQQVTGLRSGMYLLQVPGFEIQKIIVTGGSGNGATESKQVINNNDKL